MGSTSHGPNRTSRTRQVVLLGTIALLIPFAVLVDFVRHFDDYFSTMVNNASVSDATMKETNVGLPGDVMSVTNMSLAEHPPNNTVLNSSDISSFGMQNSTSAIQTSRAKEEGKCCYYVKRDLTEVFSSSFFEEQSKLAPDSFTGDEYVEWKSIEAKEFPPSKRNPDQHHCFAQWRLTVFEQSKGLYLRSILNEYKSRKPVGPNAEFAGFPYVQDKPDLPRILYLGDSISRGTWRVTIKTYKDLANIHPAPTNCVGFSAYRAHLSTWLGECPWDLIQFNVGMHYHPRAGYGDDLEEYERQLDEVLQALHTHSPQAHLVLATTTPSPFDTDGTTPDRETCPHYDRFHERGYVAKLNHVVHQVAEKWTATKSLSVGVSERYDAVINDLKAWQTPCDIHFKTKPGGISPGYRRIAQADWTIASRTLHLGWPTDKNKKKKKTPNKA